MLDECNSHMYEYNYVDSEGGYLKQKSKEIEQRQSVTTVQCEGVRNVRKLGLLRRSWQEVNGPSFDIAVLIFYLVNTSSHCCYCNLMESETSYSRNKDSKANHRYKKTEDYAIRRYMVEVHGFHLNPMCPFLLKNLRPSSTIKVWNYSTASAKSIVDTSWFSIKAKAFNNACTSS
uniref:Uncharacterized protein n=1 Tax=Glossina austeni TaxID=7395 RepID=A0A1A9VAA7_GLOAU